MENRYDNKFLAVVPAENLNITGDKEIERYFYKIIVSQPNEHLIKTINEIINTVSIYGIITRGSLANYLYVNNLPVPIFDLQFDFKSLMTIFEQCNAKGYKKICIFEIGYKDSENTAQNQYSHTNMGDYEFLYYKIFDDSDIEAIIYDISKNKNADVIIGDVKPAELAIKFDIPVIRIDVTIDAWQKTINQACHSTDIAMKEKSKNNFIELITNIISEAVIIIDGSGNVRRYNLQAEKLFFRGTNYSNIIDIFKIEIDELLSAPANDVIKVQEINYVVNILPIIIENEQMYSVIINNVAYVENLELSIRKHNQNKGLIAKTYFKDIIYKDNETKRVIETAKKYAKSNGSIVIYGETGTGKEVLASSIHNESLRSDGPFVAINCASFNENLIESELFGYEKGSFTGALSSGKKGLFEIAHNGTLFLDEIGELPISLQAKLLRVIQEKEIMRIGGDKVIPVSVRILSATNKDLKKMVKNNLFREDLYYRLSLLEIKLPPLRDRTEDIIPLFTSFLKEISEEEGKSIYWDDESVFSPLLNYEWPGNIRELRNFAERIIILSERNKISLDFIKRIISEKYDVDSTPEYSTKITNDLKELESNYISFLLNKFGGDKEKLCEYLNISKTTLWRKLNE